MSLSISDIITSAFSSPGMPKMWVTPSVSRHLTRRSDAFMELPFQSATPAAAHRLNARRTMRPHRARVNAPDRRITPLFEELKDRTGLQV